MNEDSARDYDRSATTHRAAAREATASSAAPRERSPGSPYAAGAASHASHFRYALPGSGEACLIEPTVQCNHCGYCQSHGH